MILVVCLVDIIIFKRKFFVLKSQRGEPIPNRH